MTRRCPACRHPFARAEAARRAGLWRRATNRQLAVFALVYVVLGSVLTLFVEVFIAFLRKGAR